MKAYFTLSETVANFAVQAQGLTDTELEQPWTWQSYDSEGIRFAFFRIYEDLNALAVRLETARLDAGLPLSRAQRILGQYHAAYRDLQAAVLGITAPQSLREPAPGEWSVRRIYAHILGADLGFYGLVRYALDLHRQGAWQPGKIPDEAWDRMLDLDEPAYVALMNAPFNELCAYHGNLHARILDEFAGILDEELELSAVYWEAESYALGFRLGRFDSHMRQHTIQIDKALALPVLSAVPSEARRLLRLVYAALARVGAACIGADSGVGEKIIGDTAGRLQQWVEDIIDLCPSAAIPPSSG